MIFEAEGEAGEGMECGGVVAREGEDEAIELLFEAEEAGGMVEGGIDAVEVEARDVVFDGAAHGVI